MEKEAWHHLLQERCTYAHRGETCTWCRTGPCLDSIPEGGELTFADTYAISYPLYFVTPSPFIMHHNSVEQCVPFASKAPVAQRGEDNCPKSHIRTRPPAMWFHAALSLRHLGCFTFLSLHYVSGNTPIYSGSLSPGATSAGPGSWSPTCSRHPPWILTKSGQLRCLGCSTHRHFLSLSLKVPELRVSGQMWERRRGQRDFWHTAPLPEVLVVQSYTMGEMEFPGFSRMRWTSTGPSLSPGTNTDAECIKWSRKPLVILGSTSSRTGLHLTGARRGGGLSHCRKKCSWEGIQRKTGPRQWLNNRWQAG